MQNIYEIIPKNKLDIVSKSIEKAHGLPNECYSEGIYTNIERELKADVIEINLETRDTKIYMLENHLGFDIVLETMTSHCL